MSRMRSQSQHNFLELMGRRTVIGLQAFGLVQKLGGKLKMYRFAG